MIEISFFRIFLIGRTVLRKAHIIEEMKSCSKIKVGKTKGTGRSERTAYCIAIVKPSIPPTTMPIKQLDKTRTKASKLYSNYILNLVIPTARRMEISLVYSVILADIELTRLKKHKITAITERIRKIISVSF
jgi:hypothetical protein